MSSTLYYAGDGNTSKKLKNFVELGKGHIRNIQDETIYLNILKNLIFKNTKIYRK